MIRSQRCYKRQGRAASSPALPTRDRHRIRGRRLPVPDPLDWLCAVLDQLTAPRSPAGRARYVRVARSHARPGAAEGAWLATETRTDVRDAEGRLVEVGAARADSPHAITLTGTQPRPN